MIKIRDATAEDADAIVAAERAIAETPGFFCSQPSELSIDNVIKTLTRGVYLVAECEGELVGHAFLESFQLQSLRHVAQLNIAIHLGWQGKGIGTKLLEELIKRAKKTQIEKIELNVRATNLSAIALYKKMGFEEEGRLKKRVKVTSGYIDDIIMGLVFNE